MSLFRILLLSVVVLIVNGCMAPHKLNPSTVAIRPTLQAMVEPGVGQTRAEVLQRLGEPSTVILLPDQRRIDHYYSDKLESLGIDALSKNKGDVARASYASRSWRQLDVFYVNGKVVRSVLTQEQRQLPENLQAWMSGLRGQNLPFGNDETAYITFRANPSEYREALLWSRSIEPRINQGSAYDQAAAERIVVGTPLHTVMWSLGSPSRIVSSGKGEWFIYEKFGLEPSAGKLVAFHGERTAFLVDQGRVVDRRHHAGRWNIPSLEDSRAPLNLTRLTSHDFLQGLDAHGTGKTLVKGDLKLEPPYDEMARFIADTEFADVPPAAEAYFARVINKQIAPDYLILKAAALKTEQPGAKILPDFLNGDTVLATQVANTSDRVWLNLGVLDKVYFTGSGAVDTVIQFSPFSPHSPWYAFGPTVQNQLGREYLYNRCARGDECQRSLIDIYSGNIVVPWP